MTPQTTAAPSAPARSAPTRFARVTEPRPLEGVKKLTAGQIGAFGRARREGSGSVAGLNVVEDGLGGFGYVGS